MGKRKFSDVIKYFFVNIIFSNMIWTLIISVPAALLGLAKTATVITKILDKTPVTSEVFLAILGVSICILVLILDIIYFIRYQIRRKHRISFPDVKSDYSIKTCDFELCFLNREEMIQTQTIEYHVLSNRLSNIPHSINWTGEQYIESHLASESLARNYCLVETKRSVPPYDIKITFPEQRRGEVDSYSFVTTVQDKNHQMIPILSRFIKCKTQSLTLRVTVPHGLVKNVNFLIYGDFDREVILAPAVRLAEKKLGNGLCYYEISVTDLEILHYYAITWDFIE